jgi:hypothetical protein
LRTLRADVSIPDPASTTTVLRLESRWAITPSGDAFDRIVLLGEFLTIGRAESSHVFAPRLACPEVPLAWSEDGLTAAAVGGSIYQEASHGEWDDPPPLSIPCRLFVVVDDDPADQIRDDYEHGGGVDEGLDLIEVRSR